MADARDAVPFDQKRLRNVLSRTVDGRGEILWFELPDGRVTALLLPPAAGPGSPIYVTAVADEAVVGAGMGAQLFLSSEQAGDEDHVAEVVAAIMDGGASQYALVREVPDTPVQIRLVIIGAFGEYTFNVEDAIPIGSLPAWPRTADD